MEPLLGLPWHCGCYLSPNSCWSNAEQEEWPGITGTVAVTCPRLDAAGSYEVFMEEIEGFDSKQGFSDHSEPGNCPEQYFVPECLWTEHK